MATIKNTSNVLGNLINQINSAAPIQSSQPNNFSASFGGYQNSANADIDDDSIPSNMLNPEPVFEMNYKSTKKQCVKRAKDQLQIIVNEVVPALLQNSKMIMDKISQDSEQLGNLYYEYEKTDKVVQALMDTISRGETQARLFEVYTKMSNQQQTLSSKITETQNQMRKYYIDTYLDLQQKDNADEALGITSDISETAALSQPAEDSPAIKNNVIVGTEQTIKMLEEKKRLAMEAKFATV